MTRIHFRNRFHKYCKILRALIARAITVAHGAVAVHLTAQHNSYFYLLGLLVVLFIAETYVIIYFRSGIEWKRYCTCFLCYLLTIVPCLWLQRLELTGLSPATNQTQASEVTGKPVPLLQWISAGNATSNDTALQSVLSKVNTPSFLEQSMMFVLILVRWLLPRGLIDRDSLSQLLIMYCAIGADILDFSEIFDKIPKDAENNFRYIVLGVWSWSLLQFTLVLTTTFKNKKQIDTVAHLDPETRMFMEDNETESELVSLLIAMLLQDGPFVVIRFYTIFSVGVNDYLIIFFALKNIMTLILGLFRMLVLCGFIAKDGNDILILEKEARPARRNAAELPGKRTDAERPTRCIDEIDDGSLGKKKTGESKKFKRNGVKGRRY